MTRTLIEITLIVILCQNMIKAKAGLKINVDQRLLVDNSLSMILPFLN